MKRDAWRVIVIELVKIAIIPGLIIGTIAFQVYSSKHPDKTERQLLLELFK